MLRCEGGGGEPDSASQARRKAPVFPAARYLETRYGAPKNSTGALRIPLTPPKMRVPHILRSHFDVGSSGLGAPAEAFQYAVPAFCQTYRQNGQWRALLVVTMYYKPKVSPYDPSKVPAKGAFPDLVHSYSVATVFAFRKGHWVVQKERQFFLPPAQSRPGWKVSRLWKLPGGEHVFLDIHHLLLDREPEGTFCVAYVYKVAADGSLKELFDVELLFRETQFLPDGSWDRFSKLSVSQGKKWINFFQEYHVEAQDVGKPPWTSEPDTYGKAYAKGKLRGADFFHMIP